MKSLVGWPCCAMVPFLLAASEPSPPPRRVDAACGSLPSSAPVQGLATGQLVISGETATLRFSSKLFTCADWALSTSSEPCESSWQMTLTLPSAQLTPGSHKLSEIGTTFGDLVAHQRREPREGCGADQCKASVNGIGAIAIEDPEATLHLTSIDEGCVTGELSGLKDPLFDDAPDFNGAFFAIRCP